MANTIDILGDEAAAATIIDKSVTSFVDDALTNIGVYAFYNCSNLTSVDFPLVTNIGTNAFYNCSNLTSADFPLVTNIGTNAFRNCSNLTSVDFPLVTNIGDSAFDGCNSLASADFPLVTNIGVYAFYNCSNLTTLILRSSTRVKLVNTNAFSNCSAIIYVPDELVDDYKAATNWSKYADRIKGISELPGEE